MIRVTSKTTINIDLRQFQGDVRKAFKETALVVDRNLKEAITANVWDWPKAPSPRDIVDTGRLRASQMLQLGDNYARYVWPVEYAAAVHEGVSFKNGNKNPPRRWTDYALEKDPPVAIFADFYSRL